MDPSMLEKEVREKNKLAKKKGRYRAEVSPQ